MEAMERAEKVQETAQELQERRLITNFAHQPLEIVLPSLPPELAQMFQFHNQDLGLEYFGLVFAIWTAQPFLPLRRGTFSKNLRIKGMGIKARHLVKMLKTLEERRIIELRYPQNSPWFDAAVLTPGTSGRSNLKIDWTLLRSVVAGVDLTPVSSGRSKNQPLLRPVVAGVNTELRPVVAGVGLTPATTGPVVVVDLKKQQQQATPAEIRLALSGRPFEWLSKHVPHFQAGHLIPHFQEAAVFAPNDPVARVRGAVAYMASTVLQGRKINNLLGALRKHITEGHVLEEWPDETVVPIQETTKKNTHKDRVKQWQKEQEKGA